MSVVAAQIDAFCKDSNKLRDMVVDACVFVMKKTHGANTPGWLCLPAIVGLNHGAMV